MLPMLLLPLSLAHATPPVVASAASADAASADAASADAAPLIAVVPGCPVQEDGQLSTCLQRRATWAAMLHDAGQVDGFITSGADVYTPYVEAEALGDALVALGVPADRIWLEPYALHTDENVYNAMLVARSQGWRLAVASDRMQARGGCKMLRAWGEPCEALPMPYGDVYAQMEARQAVLDAVRPAVVADHRSLTEQEAEREALSGRSRPGSLWLYSTAGIRRALGRQWVPTVPPGAGTLLPYTARDTDTDALASDD